MRIEFMEIGWYDAITFEWNAKIHTKNYNFMELKWAKI